MTQAAIDIQYQEAEINPYRTPQDDIDLWKKTDQKI